MKKIRITAVRKVQHSDLSAVYENPIEHTCDIEQGTIFISVDGQRPDGLCESAWDSMSSFVTELANGGGNFYDGWMRNPHSALISFTYSCRAFSIRI